MIQLKGEFNNIYEHTPYQSIIWTINNDHYF